MAQKESEDFSIDYEFISRYIRDDSKEDKKNIKKVFETEKQNPNEVFGSIGEGESFSKNFNLHKNREEDSTGIVESDVETLSESKPISEAKKEFIKHIEDDSLTIDTCSRLNHDWKNQ